MLIAPNVMSRQMKAIGSPMLAHVPAPVGTRSAVVAVPKVIALTVLLLALSVVSGLAIWWLFADDPRLARNFEFDAGVVAFSFAFIASLKSQLSPWLAPAYAIASGLFMGGLAFAFEARYPGIATQTVLVTTCVFAAMLLHSDGCLRATPRFRLVVYVVASAGIAMAYLVALWACAEG